MTRRFLILSTIVGLVAGLIGSAFHLSADAVLSLHQGIPGPLWLRLPASMIASCVMIVLALYLVRRYAPEAGGSGIPEVEGAIDDQLTVRWFRVLFVKFFGGILSIGSGAVLGREGPTIHIGAAVAEGFAERTTLGSDERRGLLAAGAAAGLATAFSAPVASVLFVMEETRREFPYSFSTFSGVIAASICAGVVTQLVIGTGPLLPVDVPRPDSTFVLFAAILGVVLGVVGVLFNTSLMATIHFLQRRGRPVPYAVAGVFGAAVGAIVVLYPASVQGGEGLITALVVRADALGLLAILLVMRFVMTLLSYGIGAPGGLFAPLLALAACVGLVYAAIVNLLPLDVSVQMSTTAVVAMAGLFAATVRAPLVGVVLTAELTGAFDLLLPLLTCAFVAHVTAHTLGGRPIYAQLLERRIQLEGKRRAEETTAR